MTHLLRELFGHPVVGVMCVTFLVTIALVLALSIFTDAGVGTLNRISLAGTMLGLLYGAGGVIVYELRGRRR